MKNKHLTLSDRNDIQIGIEQLKPFSAIAVKLGKDPSTISKEVRRNRVINENSSTSNCEACPLLKKAPYVCNACPKKRSNCGYQKQFYYAKRAQLDYEAKLSDSRTGVALNKEEFYRMDEIVSAAIQKGQHLNHIIASNELSASRASIYRYLEKGYLSTKPIDFPRVVKFRKRRIEKNHTLIRDILPKGSSFDNLTQEDINLVCSHVNSVKRASFNGKSAYELFTFTYGDELATLLGISKIDPENVIQSPRLLDK